MKDWNVYEQAYLDLLESVSNGSKKSMGKPTSMRFWEKFATRLSENQGFTFTVNAADCIDQLEYLQTLYNQLKLEPEPEHGSYLQLCRPEFRLQLSNIFDSYTIEVPFYWEVRRWKKRENRCHETSSRPTSSRSGLGSNSVTGDGGDLSSEVDWKERVTKVLYKLTTEKKLDFCDVSRLDILYQCKKSAERLLRCESDEKMLKLIHQQMLE